MQFNQYSSLSLIVALGIVPLACKPQVESIRSANSGAQNAQGQPRPLASASPTFQVPSVASPTVGASPDNTATSGTPTAIPTASSSASTTPMATATATVTVTPVQDHILFLTPQKHSGDLGGLAGADAKCQQAAEDAKLVGQYKAVLSAKDVHAKDRIKIIAKVVDVKGKVITASAAEFWDAKKLESPVGFDSQGSELSEKVQYWTGTNTVGMRLNAQIITGAFSFSCKDWTFNVSDPIFNGGTGRNVDRDGKWLQDRVESCDTQLRIMCIRQ